LHNQGDEKVLSHQVIILCFLPKFAINYKSIILKVGFVGV